MTELKKYPDNTWIEQREDGFAIMKQDAEGGIAPFNTVRFKSVEEAEVALKKLRPINSPLIGPNAAAGAEIANAKRESLLREPTKAKMSVPIRDHLAINVTKGDGVPLPNQSEALQNFWAQCERLEKPSPEEMMKDLNDGVGMYETKCVGGELHTSRIDRADYMMTTEQLHDKYKIEIRTRDAEIWKLRNSVNALERALGLVQAKVLNPPLNMQAGGINMIVGEGGTGGACDANGNPVTQPAKKLTGKQEWAIVIAGSIIGFVVVPGIMYLIAAYGAWDLSTSSSERGLYRVLSLFGLLIGAFSGVGIVCSINPPVKKEEDKKDAATV